MPIRASGRSNVFNVDYGDFAPRFSIAWNPSYGSGFLGHMFGDRKTVIRGGYGISYDRINTVGSVIIPMLGVGFAQTLSVGAPGCAASGTPGVLLTPQPVRFSASGRTAQSLHLPHSASKIYPWFPKASLLKL